MASSKICLNIIARNEEKTIGQTLASVIPFVDQAIVLDTGSTDKTVEICRGMGAQVIEVGEKFTHKVTKEEVKWVRDYLGPYTFVNPGDKLFLFGDARQYLLEQTPKEYDWILWLDADDVFQGKEYIRQIVDNAEGQQAQMVFLNYLYHSEFNPDGTVKNILIQHLRERFFKNDGSFKWEAQIHETLVDQRPTMSKKINVEVADVLHLTQLDDMKESIQRNIRNLEWEIYRTKAEDPRPIYYLAKAYYDLGDEKHLKEAERLIKAYCAGSGWPEERGQAWEYVGWIRQKFGDYKNAVKACMNSLIENPGNPSAFITLSQVYMQMGDWEKALFWIKQSAHVPQPKTTLVLNPKDLMAKTFEVIFQASINSVPADIDRAWAAITKLNDLHPGMEAIENNLKIAESLRKERDLTVKAAELAQYLLSTGQKDKVQMLIAALPQEVASNQIMTSFLQHAVPPRVHADNEITIFAGPGFEIWSPKTIEERGSGGSEEAIYRLGKELAHLGWKVTVYASPGADRGTHDGVDYREHYEINLQDQFNIFVAWRRPELVDQAIKAKKHYVWLHDIPMIREFTEERVKKMTKVIVLSKYHAGLLELREIEGRTYGVPPEKLLVSQNGITIEAGQAIPTQPIEGELVNA